MRVLALAGAFLLCGVAALATAGALEFDTAQWRTTAQTAPGVVVRLLQSTDGGFAPVIRFRPPGAAMPVEWQSTRFSYPSAFAVGEAVPMLFQPANARDAAPDTFFALHLGTVIAGALGAVFAPLGLLLLAMDRVPRRRRAWLELNGTPVRAVIVAVQRDPDARQPQWRIHAQTSDLRNARVQMFRSDPIGFDPSPLLGSRKSVEVRVDPRRPTRYAMDLGFLPRGV
jgi:hypothetical protein